MDGKWIPGRWRQTGHNDPVQAPTEGLTKVFDEIASKTAQLVQQPYNAGHWGARAELLTMVGYPELAAGDARKSQILCTAMLEGKGLSLAARKQLLLDDPSTNTAAIPEPLQYQPLWTETVKQLRFRSFMVLSRALSQAGAFHSFREMCLEARAMYPADDVLSSGLASSDVALKSLRRNIQQSHALGRSQTNVDEQLKFGRISFRLYPFMPPQYLQRSAERITSANTRLVEMGAACVVRASSLGSSAAIPEPPLRILGPWNRTLGLFATSDIKKGDVILKDTTTWGTNTEPAVVYFKYQGRAHPMPRCDNCCGITPPWNSVVHQSKCCNTTYCSDSCLKTAKATYHQVLCGKDFSWITNKPQSGGRQTDPGLSDTIGSMWLRILATCVQSGLHPLEHPSIAALTANYESDDRISRRWSLAFNIDVPQRILTTLGVDIFKDLRYDTWVLQTIWARMTNNQRGEIEKGLNGPVVSRSVHQLFSFINHSCEPNAEAEDLSETYPPQTAPVVCSSALAIFARKNIKAGEELFISYANGETLGQSRAVWNYNLQLSRLSGDCLCARCKREAQGEEGK
ncbi:uncharacterized protein LY89DRAFT_786439 [Mollisia scopiformis]|uniref:Histone-lysine N-methyltransferase SET5 n=1 Tax=Mollisia scopiformis TaxID=149040 RepID=A0A194WU88_MOLSC|nr:uncharacterized protein LY89DRAFT_786439 [Mollisia scopiformis]KUJ11523.1 hypothetical protein LY89DRAFT_786439 [Mollisia scopiformis]